MCRILWVFNLFIRNCNSISLAKFFKFIHIIKSIVFPLTSLNTFRDPKNQRVFIGFSL